MVASVVLALLPQCAIALQYTPGVIEPGDAVSFTIPVQNSSVDSTTLTHVRVVLLTAPSWMQLQSTSIQGPINLPPGQGMHFRLDFQVGQSYVAGLGPSEITAQIVSETPNLDASKFVWHFRSSNGFLTSTTECLDEAGHSFDGSISPDQTPPITQIFFVGANFADPSGNVYIATATSIGLNAVDPPVQDADESGVAFTGYLIDQAATSITQLIPFTSTFTLASGNHSIVFASSDNASNVETLRAVNLAVDGTSPTTQIQVSGSSGTAALANLLVTTSSLIGFISSDPIVAGVASGVNQIFYSLDGSSFTAFQTGFSLSLGSHQLQFYAVDNVGNAEAPHVISILVVSANSASSGWSTFTHDNQHAARITGIGPTIPTTGWTASISPVGGQTSAIVGPDNAVYLPGYSNGYGLFAFNPDGTRKWTFSNSPNLPLTPALARNGVLYLSVVGDNNPPFQTHLYAVNPDGSQKWRIDAPGCPSCLGFGTPAIGNDGTVYVAYAQQNASANGSLYAISPDTGGILWSLDLGNPLGFGGGAPVTIGPDGTVYVPLLTNTIGILDAISSSGSIKWSITTPTRRAVVPSIARNGQLMLNSDYLIQALDPTTGNALWTFDERSVDRFASGGSPNGSPSIGPDGSLYFYGASNFSMIALNSDGSFKWMFGTPNAFPLKYRFPTGLGLGPPVDAQGNVYVAAIPNGASTSAVYALSPSGAIQWQYQLPEIPDMLIMGDDGSLYLGNTSLLKIAQPYTAVSPDNAVSLVSNVAGISITNLSTTTPSVALDLTTATAQGLLLVSGVYNITPGESFSPSANLAFGFTPSVVEDTSTLAVYFFNGIQWSSATAGGIATQSVNGSNLTVTASVAGTGVAALFVKNIDRLPPRTSVAVGSPSFGNNPVYVSTATPIGLASVDDRFIVGDGRGFGVLQTLVAVDTAPFSVYTAPFFIPIEGIHTIRYYSVDVVGNAEAVNTSTVAVDATPPATRLQVLGPGLYASTGTLYASSTATFGLTGQDPISRGASSGLQQIQYSINGSSYAVYTGTFTLGPGSSQLQFFGIDNVENAELPHSLLIVSVAPPAVPGNVAFTSVTTRAVTVSWGANGNQSGTQYIATLSQTSSLSPPFATIQTVSQTVSFTNLSPATSYYVGVYAQAIDGVTTSTALPSPAFALTTANPPAIPASFGIGPAADLVLGQQNFSASAGAQLPAGMFAPLQAISDAAGNIWVADTDNSRVLEFVPPFTNGMQASVVIGQPNPNTFNFPGTLNPPAPTNIGNPGDLTFDAAGDLWVADIFYKRIMRFSPPFSNGMAADLILPATTISTGGMLTSPAGIVFDPGGNLWVSDNTNSRVLEFAPPFYDGMNASLVLGQPGFTTGSPGSGANGLGGPRHLAVDAFGDVWVADAGNNRTLEYIPPFTNGMNASLVIGQAGFATNAQAVSASGMFNPTGLTFNSGVLWINDQQNNRVLQFIPPFSSGMSASQVIGQTNLGARVQASGPNGLFGPQAVSFDPSGNIWITDTGNSRILHYTSLGSFAMMGTSSITISWSANLNSSGALYDAQLSADPTFGSYQDSGFNPGVSYTFTNLMAGTTYYARARTKNLDGSLTAFTLLGSGMTNSAPNFTLPQISTDGISWQSTSAVLAQTSSDWARIVAQDAVVGLSTATGSYAVRYSTNGGSSWISLPGSSVTLTAAGGPTAPFTITAQGLALAHSLTLNAVNFVATNNSGVVSQSSFTIQTEALVQSTTAVAGTPELVFIAPVTPTIQLISTGTAPGSVALQAATTQGLTLVSDLYDLGPENVAFNPLASITFHYDPALLASEGLSTSTLAIYDYNIASGSWVSLGGTVSANANSITVNVASLASILAVLSTGRQDSVPPRTTISFGTPSLSSAPVDYVSDATTFSLTAVDDALVVGDGLGVGVAATFIGIDTTTFSIYGGTFSLSSEGLNTVAYYSVDQAGHAEIFKSTTVAVDLTAPVSQLSVSGSSATIAGVVYLSSATVFSLSSFDPVSNGVASGVQEIFYVVDADPFSPACQAVPPDLTLPSGTCANEAYGGAFTLSGGTHTVYFFAEDAVDNQEAEHLSSFTVDAIPPVTTVLVNGATAFSNPISVSPTDIVSLSAFDAGSGVAASYVAADGGAYNLYGGPFNISTGSHTLSAFSVDNVGNREAARSYTVLSSSSGPGQFPPGPDTAVNRSTNEINVFWDPNGNGAGTQYNAFIAAAPSDGSCPSSNPFQQPSATNSNSFVFSGLTPSAFYAIDICNPALLGSSACDAPLVVGTNLSGFEANPPYVVCNGGAGQAVNPYPPSPTVVVGRSSGTISLSWAGNNNPFQTLYGVRVMSGNGVCGFNSSSQPGGSSPGVSVSSSAALISGLQAGTTYEILVCAQDSRTGLGVCNQEIAAAAGLGGFEAYPPYGPCSTGTAGGAQLPGPSTVLARDSSSISLKWGANGNPSGTLYNVVYATSNGSCSFLAQQQAIQVSTTVARITGLLAGTTYVIDICNPAITGGNSCDTNIVVMTGTGGTENFPAFVTCGGGGGPSGGNTPGPSFLTFTNNTDPASISLSWDPNGNPSGTLYQVVYAPALSGNVCATPNNLAQQMTSSTSIVLSGLSSQTSYYIDVCNQALLTSSGTVPCNQQVIAETASNSLFFCSTSSGPGGGPPPSFGSGQAIGVDSAGKIWEIAQQSGAILLEKYSSDGTALKSTSTIPGGAQDSTWSLGFDSSGNVYAVGGSSDAQGISDLAVFKASGQNVLMSSASYDAGGQVNSLAFDAYSYPAGGSLWITGGLQAGSFKNGTAQIQLALWRYSFQTGVLSLAATFSRGHGGDAGFGVRVASGTVWVAGYSATTSAGLGGSMDLGLWGFDPGSGALVKGPYFVPGVLPNGVQGDLGAKLEVAGTGLAVAGSRQSGSSLQVGFYKFDQGGNLLLSRAWTPASGPAPVVKGIAADSQGRIAAAGLFKVSTGSTLGVWGYNPDGSFISAFSDPAAPGGAHGIAFSTNAYLAVDGSGAPYKFGFNTSLAGTDVLLSSGAAPSDTTPPLTSIHIGQPFFVDASSNQYVSPVSSITFTAIDPANSDGSAGSGVKQIEVSLDSAPFAALTAALSLAEGRHTIQYFAADNAGNADPVHTISLRSDATPPITKIRYSTQPFSDASGRSFLSTTNFLFFSSTDPVSNNVASGVAFTRYRLNQGSFVSSTGTFTLPEGIDRLDFQSQDNVQNLELLESVTGYIDGTPPVTSLTVSTPLFNGYVSSATLFTISALDPVVNQVASGVAFTQYRVNGSTFTVFSGTASFTLAGPDGTYKIDDQSQDNVGNLEVLKSSSVILDETPPTTTLSVDGVASSTSGIVAASTSVFSLHALDSGSGVAATLLTIDGGAAQVYSSTFTLSVGSHTLSFQSRDNVSNLEGLHTVLATVRQLDTTPPVTSLVLGLPDLKAFGIDLISTGTTVSLSAVDPGVGASGVAKSFYRVDTGTWTTPPSVFYLSQGMHVIAYYSVDNAGNTETVKTSTVAVADFIGGAAAGVSGVTLSGGNTRVYGLVQSNQTVALSGGSEVVGPVIAKAVTTSGGSVVTGAEGLNQTPLIAQPIDLGLIGALAEATSSNALVPSGFISNGALNVPGGTTLTLATGTYVFNGLTVSGSGVLKTNGPVSLFIKGAVTVSGGSNCNTGGPSVNLVVISSSTQNASFDGNVEGIFYAPLSALSISGLSVKGPVFANTVSVSGGATLTAGDAVGGSVLGVAAVIGGNTASPAAVAPADFVFRDLYAFPNPAKHGHGVTIRMQPGLADEVDIVVYDVSGHEVRTGTSFSARIIDDGNGKGPQYSFDWPWDTVGTGSGVYLFTATAKKAGAAPIRRTGKVGLIK